MIHGSSAQHALFRKNCEHITHSFYERLRVSRMPKHISCFARIGARAEDFVQDNFGDSSTAPGHTSCPSPWPLALEAARTHQSQESTDVMRCLRSSRSKVPCRWCSAGYSHHRNRTPSKTAFGRTYCSQLANDDRNSVCTACQYERWGIAWLTMRFVMLFNFMSVWMSNKDETLLF